MWNMVTQSNMFMISLFAPMFTVDGYYWGMVYEYSRLDNVVSSAHLIFLKINM